MSTYVFSSSEQKDCEVLALELGLFQPNLTYSISRAKKMPNLIQIDLVILDVMYITN